MHGYNAGAEARHDIFDRMAVLSDTTRSRLLRVLERHEFTVGELCTILQLPQSTVSRHLKVLSDAAWVESRADGTSRRYRGRMEELDASARRLWGLVREQVSGMPAVLQDAQRMQAVLAERRTRSQEFFSTTAGEWDRLRAELFGRRADLAALLALLDEEWTVGDLGCGTGAVSESLAPFVRRIVAVDESSAMLAAARVRLGPLENVEVRSGALEALPLGDAELDAAIVSLVLHNLPDPARALREAARVLRPGGKLLVVDMMPHERPEFRQEMGHAWLGFGESLLARWLRAAGFERVRYRPIPPEPGAKGPALFAATALRAPRS